MRTVIFGFIVIAFFSIPSSIRGNIEHSIEIVPGDLKKKILVIWYEKNKSHERAVFFDFPFPLIGILSFFMFEKKDNSPLDEKNDIKAVAEIMIRNIPGKDTEMLQATFFHVKRNAFFAVKTSSNTTSSLSVEKVPLCFGLLGDRKNLDASDRDSLQESRRSTSLLGTDYFDERKDLCPTEHVLRMGRAETAFQLPKISRHCLRRSRIGMFCGHFFSHAPQEMHAEALSPVSQGFFPMELYRFSAAVSRL